jgi:hypothetical protein
MARSADGDEVTDFGGLGLAEGGAGLSPLAESVALLFDSIVHELSFYILKIIIWKAKYKACPDHCCRL